MYCENNPLTHTDPTGLKDYVYTSSENFTVENDWGIFEFLHSDRYYAEVDGERFQANSKETVELTDWESIDKEFLNKTLDSLVDKANEKPTDEKRVLSQSVGGDLDFKLQLDKKQLYLANGVLYNTNEAGNFVWSYFLESKGIMRDVSGALAQAGSLISPSTGMRGGMRFDEPWDVKARHAGAKYLWNRVGAGYVNWVLYGNLDWW